MEQGKVKMEPKKKQSETGSVSSRESKDSKDSGFSVDSAEIEARRNTLDKNFSKMISEMLDITKIFLKLAPFMSDEDQQEIKGKKTDEGKVEQLLTVVRNNLATRLYSKFFEVLKEVNPHLGIFLQTQERTRAKDYINRKYSSVSGATTLKSSNSDETINTLRGMTRISEVVEKEFHVREKTHIKFGPNSSGQDIREILEGAIKNLVRELEITDSKIEEGDVAIICEHLTKQENIEIFSLTHKKFSRDEIGEFLKKLKIMKKLKSLKFHVKCPHGFNIFPLFDIILDHADLHYLALKGCKLPNEKAVDLLMSAINMNTKLRTLSLKRIGEGDYALERLCVRPVKLRQLSEVFLDKNGIIDAGIHNLVYLLKANRVDTLSLVGNQIGDVGVDSLIPEIREMRYLNLSQNQIGTDIARKLIHRWNNCLKYNESAELFIGQNQIRVERLPISSLKHPKIDITQDCIGRERIEILLKRMEKGESFFDLNLNGIELWDEHLALLIDPLCDRPTLRELHVADNHLTDKCIKDILELKTCCEDLKVIDITGNNISIETLGESSTSEVAKKLQHIRLL